MTQRLPTVQRASANESPYPPPPAVLDAVARAAATAHHYPEVYPEELAVAVAAHHGVPADHVAVGAGAAGLIQQMLHLVARAKGHAVFAWRSFEGYPLIADAMGVPSTRVPLRGYAHDLPAMAKAVRRRTKVVFVCNPNNPTGTGVDRADLERFLDRVPRRVFVVLDEVYRDFATHPDTADGRSLYPDHPNLVVLRSFSKSYGLAGLRVGYAIGHPGPIAALRAVTMPFLLSRVASDAAVAALAAEAEFRERRAAIAGERERVVEALAAAGRPVPPSEANFVWLPLGAASGRFAAACEREGLLVHAFGDEGVRATITTPDTNDLLVAVARAGSWA